MVITLSRQAESGGDDIAELVAHDAGLRLADRVIVEQMAQRTGLPLAAVELFDEAVPGPIESLLSEWQTSVSHMVYLRRLIRSLLALERENDVIVVGRGAAFVMQDPTTSHVRVIAPMPCRIARVMERGSLTRPQAERLLRHSDEERRRFVQQSFGAEIDNPAHYDLVLNTAEMSYDTAAEIIIRAAQRKASVRRDVRGEIVQDLLTQAQWLGRRAQQPRVSETVWKFCQRRRTRPAG